MTKKELLETLNELGKALEQNKVRKCNSLTRKLNENLPFKNEQQKSQWLSCLSSFKFWEDFEELTIKIINQRSKNKE